MFDPDRRRAQRIPLQQAVSVVIGNDGHEAPAITDNFSSAGVLLYADQLIPEGSEIGLILVVPPVEAEYELTDFHAAIAHAERAGRHGKVLLTG